MIHKIADNTWGLRTQQTGELDLHALGSILIEKSIWQQQAN